MPNSNQKYLFAPFVYLLLSFKEKSLIIKAFGLSLLVYGLQVVDIKGACLVRTARFPFGFVWIGCKSEKERRINRIKRSVLKNTYEAGGSKYNGWSGGLVL